MKRAILLVDHGSRRAEANELLEEVAECVRQRVPDQVVAIAHMELAEPDIGTGIDACVGAGATKIVVHPYFLGPGNHTSQDIPQLVRSAAARYPGVDIAISPPLGLHERIVEVILERVEAAAKP